MLNSYKTGEQPEIGDAVVWAAGDSAKVQVVREPTITAVVELDHLGHGVWVLTSDGFFRMYVDPANFRLVHRANRPMPGRIPPVPVPGVPVKASQTGAKVETQNLPGIVWIKAISAFESAAGSYILLALLEDRSLWELRPAEVSGVAWRRIPLPYENSQAVEAVDRP